ncbi:MAG TPA: outer membrane lipoprotein LolB, partial [Armatimonadota bacterium]
MNRFFLYLMTVAGLLLSSGCAITPHVALDYTPGVVVETLSSSVSLSIHTTDRSMGGHGYLVFRRPDQLHLVVLSPFGTTMLEAFALGEQITLVYPAQMTA